MLLILTSITLALIPVMHAMAARAAHASFRPAQRGRCFEGIRRDDAGAPASLPRGCPARLVIAFPTDLGTEGDPIAPSASSLRTASCDSDPPLIPPVTHTRSLAWAPEGRLVTCSATRRDARGRYRTVVFCLRSASVTTASTVNPSRTCYLNVTICRTILVRPLLNMRRLRWRKSKNRQRTSQATPLAPSKPALPARKR